MLDLELVTAPVKTGLDIVPLVEMKKHLRITHSKLDDTISQAIEDAADKLDGIGGDLNRSVFERTWKRYLTKFPGFDIPDPNRSYRPFGNYGYHGKPLPIQLPFPPVIQVLAVTIEDGSSPANILNPAAYQTKLGVIVPEIHPVGAWPTVPYGPRAISVTYRAGYTDYPKKLKRMIKFLAAHYMENPEATINEARQMMVNRRVDFAMDDLLNALRVPISYDDWNE